MTRRIVRFADKDEYYSCDNMDDNKYDDVDDDDDSSTKVTSTTTSSVNSSYSKSMESEIEDIIQDVLFIGDINETRQGHRHRRYDNRHRCRGSNNSSSINIAPLSKEEDEENKNGSVVSIEDPYGCNNIVSICAGEDDEPILDVNITTITTSTSLTKNKKKSHKKTKKKKKKRSTVKKNHVEDNDIDNGVDDDAIDAVLDYIEDAAKCLQCESLANDDDDGDIDDDIDDEPITAKNKKKKKEATTTRRMNKFNRYTEKKTLLSFDDNDKNNCTIMTDSNTKDNEQQQVKSSQQQQQQMHDNWSLETLLYATMSNYCMNNSNNSSNNNVFLNNNNHFDTLLPSAKLDEMISGLSFNIVKIKIPMGLLFEENEVGCYVANIIPSGNAEKLLVQQKQQEQVFVGLEQKQQQPKRCFNSNSKRDRRKGKSNNNNITNNNYDIHQSAPSIKVGDQLAAINGFTALNLKVDELYQLVLQTPKYEDVELTLVRYTGGGTGTHSSSEKYENAILVDHHERDYHYDRLSLNTISSCSNDTNTDTLSEYTSSRDDGDNEKVPRRHHWKKLFSCSITGQQHRPIVQNNRKEGNDKGSFINISKDHTEDDDDDDDSYYHFLVAGNDDEVSDESTRSSSISTKQALWQKAGCFVLNRKEQ